MKDELLDLFESGSKPNWEAGYKLYNDAIGFNAQLQLSDNVRLNENFYIGKQWEGVESNGLPTPQINIIKRVVGFIVASITSDNIQVTSSALANVVGNSGYKDLVRIVNDEFSTLIERISLPTLIREFARNSAVDGDGCIYTYWDSKMETGQESKGGIRSEIIENTRVFFGNPNDRDVQSQPWIMIAKREIARNARLRAKKNKCSDWRAIMPDHEENSAVDASKYTDDKVTVLQLFWRDDETDEIWSYEFCNGSSIKEPWNMNISLYPIVWLNWDYIQDCYHGQAMVTGLIPNQVFINKSLAMTMLNIMRSAFGKVIYDATKVKRWDNRVGGAIATTGGVEGVAKIIDPPAISPQIYQYIQLCVDLTEQSLGATSVALGDTRPDNTSAIVALQRAASTPHETTKQNIYKCTEELFRIYLDFMANYYGKRYVDAEPTTMERQAIEFAQEMNPDLEMPDAVPVLFDFKILKNHPVQLKLDVGASAYWSEIASTQTLDNLLQMGHIDIVDYLERVSDDHIRGRRALLDKKKRELQQQQAMAMGMGGMMPDMGGGGGGKPGGPIAGGRSMSVNGGQGYGALQRAINQTGKVPK